MSFKVGSADVVALYSGASGVNGLYLNATNVLLNPTSVFTDAFTRSNQTGGMGNGWTTFGGKLNDGTINANQAGTVTSGGSVWRPFKAPTNPTTTNQFAQFDVVAVASGATLIYPGPLVSCTDNGTTVSGYSFVWLQAGGTSGTGGWSIRAIVADVQTIIATVDGTLPARPYTMRLERFGTAITGKVNGTVVASATDSTVPAATTTGMMMYVSNLTTGTKVDNFTNGSL